jgi:hypothetical protein
MRSFAGFVGVKQWALIRGEAAKIYVLANSCGEYGVRYRRS